MPPKTAPISRFALNQLGWEAFQRLSGTILSEVLGQTYQVFGPGADGSRDGAFQGVWAGKDHSGSFTVQCKHFTGERRNLRPSDLTDEIEKAAVLAAAGLADVYVIMTNASIPAPREAKIRAMFRARGVQEVLTFGAE